MCVILCIRMGVQLCGPTVNSLVENKGGGGGGGSPGERREVGKVGELVTPDIPVRKRASVPWQQVS